MPEPRFFNKTENLYALTFLILAVFFVVASYFKNSLDYSTGEDGSIENSSAIFCFLGAYLSIQVFFLRKKIFHENALLFLLGAAAFFFIGGEEISWGQRAFAMKPLMLAQDANYQREFTIHNIRGLDNLIYYGGFSGFVFFVGILPVLSYFSQRVKNVYVKMKVPLMPKSVNLGAWLGLLFLVSLRHVVYEKGRGLVIIPDVSASLQEFREFYFYFIGWAYVAAEYFYLLKYKKIYGIYSDTEFFPEGGSFFRRLVLDLGALINRNKPLILFSLAVFYILWPLSGELRRERIDSDHAELETDSRLVVVQGESSRLTNFTNYSIERDEDSFGGKYFSLSEDNLPDAGFFSVKYSFSVPRDGPYKIFTAGSPPGPLDGVLMGIDFSAFDVVIDEWPPLGFDQKSKDAQLRNIFGNNFYALYVYNARMVFTKIGEFNFREGEHTIEFKISKKEPYKGRYQFTLDALFVVPADWKQKNKFMTLPDDVFSY